MSTVFLAGICIVHTLQLRQLQRKLAPPVQQEAAPSFQPAEMDVADACHSAKSCNCGAEQARSVQPALRDAHQCTRISAEIHVDGAWQLADIEAYLIDLDGTIYRPSGPIVGAAEFYATVLRNKPHVFLSNTGVKGPEGVRSKLARNGIIMGPKNQSLRIYTATQAQCCYMADTIPSGARIFVIAGGDADGPGSYWMKLLRQKSDTLVSSWCLRTRLTDGKAREWAAAAACGNPVYVVLFSDGSISAVTDPKTNEVGFADWSYDVVKKTSFLLSHGAQLIATAEDAFNPSTDNMPMPGPGMFCAMFRKLLHPLGAGQVHICGKGGNIGASYMVDHAISMLREQGFSGDLSRVLIVGDRLDTDIKAGTLAGIRTCLVESGCHNETLQRHFFPDAITDYVAESIAELIPPLRRSGHPWRHSSFDVCLELTQVAKHSSAGSPSALRAWQLGHGNLVYSARSGGDLPGPLILLLRDFFEQRAQLKNFSHGTRVYSSSHISRNSWPNDNLTTISVAAALEAMQALGVCPPSEGSNKLRHHPFGVSCKRVTFAQLCRKVQHSLEASQGPQPTLVFEHSFSPASSSPRGGAKRCRLDKSPSSPFKAFLSIDRSIDRSPAKMMPRAASDPSLSLYPLEKRWNVETPSRGLQGNGTEGSMLHNM